MINLIKMEIYRMFCTRSLWVIWGILAVAIVFTTYSATLDTENGVQKAAMEEESGLLLETGEIEEQPINLGMSVVVPTEAGAQVTLYDMVFANFQGKFIALFLVIFAVIFSTADLNSGYIKNVGGQIAGKSYLIYSKLIALFLYTVLTIAVFIVSQALGNLIFFGGLKLGNTEVFLRYLLAQTMLHYAIVVICMILAIVLRSNLISMIIAICLCMNMTMVVYQLIEKMIENMTGKAVQISEYAVSIRISMLPIGIGSADVLRAVLLSVIYIAVFGFAGCLIYKKRDIV